MSAGGSTGSTDSTFRRQGTQNATSWRDLTSNQTGWINDNVASSTPANNDALNSWISTQLGQQPGQELAYQKPVYDQIFNFFDPERQFAGRGVQESAASLNPFTDEYRNNTFDKYSDEVGQVLSQVRSGPEATRGGQAAAGFREADTVNRMQLNREDLVRANRNNDYQIASSGGNFVNSQTDQGQLARLNTANALNQFIQQYLPVQSQAAGFENQRQSMFNQMLPVMLQTVAPMLNQQTDDLSGQGAQSSSSLGFGMNFCCFIFMEAYRGEMPKHVRECRDEFAPEDSDRRVGYIKMAVWLVPLMRKYKFIRYLVWHSMIQPLTQWGGYYKKLPGYEKGWKYKPFVSAWFKIWKIYGGQKS